MIDDHDPSAMTPKSGSTPRPVVRYPVAQPSAWPPVIRATPTPSVGGRPRLSLVHDRDRQQLVDPFAISNDPPRSAALSQSRRCDLSNPHCIPLRLPFVVVERTLKSDLQLHLVGFRGVLKHQFLRTADDVRALAEAEAIAIENDAMLIVGVQHGTVYRALISAVLAAARAMKGNAR